MDKKTLLAAFSALLLMPASVLGLEVRTNPVAVVELFTSQGCSSCPPADRILSGIGAREDIVALAYHVDYWDYIGWADTYGDPAFSDLQRAYALSLGKNRIYTPQLVINGVGDVVGSQRDAIDAQLAGAHLGTKVDLIVADDMLDIVISGQAMRDCTIWLVRFRDSDEIVVERGENRGQTLRYSHIVTGRQVLGMLEANDSAPTRLKLPLSAVFGADNDGVAILVQEDRDGQPGLVVGAASLIQ